MVGTIVHQLTDGCSAEELEKAGLGAYYTDHGVGVYPQAAAGFPFTASVLAVKGDPIADLQEDLAAEQKHICEYLTIIANKVDLLIDSDKNDIKTWITEKHHYFCYEKKWIDDYSLEGIERRYKNYRDEQGNSYIGKLMQDLRALPNTPPTE